MCVSLWVEVLDPLDEDCVLHAEPKVIFDQMPGPYLIWDCPIRLFCKRLDDLYRTLPPAPRDTCDEDFPWF